MLVAFEGLDRSGKTTQINLISESLTNQNIKNIIFSFPDRNTETGKIINNYLTKKYDSNNYVMHLLFSANRYEKMEEINKYLSDGYIVLLDRWFYSGVVYSIALDKKNDKNDKNTKMYNYINNGINEEWYCETDKFLQTPDIIFYFDTFLKFDSFEIYETDQFQKIVKQIFDKLLVDATKIDTSIPLIDITNFIEITIKQKMIKHIS